MIARFIHNGKSVEMSFAHSRNHPGGVFISSSDFPSFWMLKDHSIKSDHPELHSDELKVFVKTMASRFLKLKAFA